MYTWILPPNTHCITTAYWHMILYVEPVWFPDHVFLLERLCNRILQNYECEMGYPLLFFNSISVTITSGNKFKFKVQGQFIYLVDQIGHSPEDYREI